MSVDHTLRWKRKTKDCKISLIQPNPLLNTTVTSCSATHEMNRPMEKKKKKKRVKRNQSINHKQSLENNNNNSSNTTQTG